MDMDFATSCPLVRPVLPRIRLLFVRSRFRSTLPSDGPSQFRPCASLVLHLHQVAQGTFTPRLLDMPSTQPRSCRQTGPSTAPVPTLRPGWRGQVPQPRSGAPQAQDLTAALRTQGQSSVPSGNEPVSHVSEHPLAMSPGCTTSPAMTVVG